MAGENRELILQREKGTFSDSNDKTKTIEYTSYYVTVAGIKIKLKPVDGTAKQLLDGFYGANR